MYDITLIGYGIAHISLLLALSRWSHLKVCVIDPYFDGGDLRRLYGSIRSNTTWQQFLDAVEPHVSRAKYAAFQAQRGAQETVLLADLVANFESIVPAAAAKVCGLVKAASYSSDSWTLTLTDGRQIQSTIISFSPGADPKSLSYPKPTLTLSAVLNGQAHVRPTDHCVVFGLSHSGTLATDILSKKCAKVTAIYKTAEPFQFAADGHYNGIKQESEAIARHLLTGAPTNVELVKAADSERVFSALLSANWLLYAIGFEKRKSVTWTVNGAKVDVTAYDATTGRLLEAPAAFGFGIAYPNSNTVDGHTYYDVSLAAFMVYCEAAAQGIVELIMR